MVPLERILNLNAYSANKQTNKQTMAPKRQSESSGEPAKEKETTAILRGDDFYNC